MSYALYKTLHLIFILVLFMSLGGLTFYVINGGTKQDATWRKGAATTHGVAMFMVLLGGFGMLARLHVSFPFPAWVWAKLTIWLMLGGVIALIWRKPELGKTLWFAIPALGGCAAYIAIYKPF